MNGRIFLVGMPGVGKTEVARVVAERIGRPAIDLDGVIVERTGMPVEEIFDSQGEPAYREQESAALEATIEAVEEAVISTGGGVVVRQENRRMLHGEGVVVWLDAPVAVLRERLAVDPVVRPLLRDPDAVEGLAQVRTPFYESIADIRIDATGDVADVADATIQALGLS